MLFWLPGSDSSLCSRDSGFGFSMCLTIWFSDPCSHSDSDSSLALLNPFFHFHCVHLGPSLSPPNHTRNRTNSPPLGPALWHSLIMSTMRIFYFLFGHRTRNLPTVTLFLFLSLQTPPLSLLDTFLCTLPVTSLLSPPFPSLLFSGTRLALPAGLPASAIKPLQLIQNAAARLIFNAPKYTHTTQLLTDLHWLPVIARIKFKTLVLAYQAIKGSAPAYIQQLIRPYTPARPLRSATSGRLAPPTHHTCTALHCTSRLLSVLAPRWWNDLPVDVRTAEALSTFKRRLKTHLFRLHLSLPPS